MQPSAKSQRSKLAIPLVPADMAHAPACLIRLHLSSSSSDLSCTDELQPSQPAESAAAPLLSPRSAPYAKREMTLADAHTTVAVAEATRVSLNQPHRQNVGILTRPEETELLGHSIDETWGYRLAAVLGCSAVLIVFGIILTVGFFRDADSGTIRPLPLE